MSITDQSDYDGNDNQASHGRALFTDYKKIIITNQQGIVYTMATAGADPLGTADATITAPSAGNDVSTFPLNNGDNVYTIQLISVPTWQAGVAYDTGKGDTVYNPTDGRLYVALTNNTGQQPDVSPNDWQILADDSELLARYSVTESVVSICDLNACIPEKVEKARCQLKLDDCNPEAICRSKEVQNANKLFLLRYSIGVKSGAEDWDSVKTLVDCTKQICNCC